MSSKDVSFVINPIKYCLSFFVSEVYLRGFLGTTRVRKGMLGSLSPGLLTPTVPYYIIYWAFIGNDVAEQKW